MMPRLEKVARAICRSTGEDPDRIMVDVQTPLWKMYTSPAQAAINALDDVDDEDAAPTTAEVVEQNYLVTWEIDVTAKSPEEAARKARELQQRSSEGYGAGVFDVTDDEGNVTRVDLDEIDQENADDA